MGAVLFGAFLVFVGALAVSLWILFAFASWLAGRFVPKRPTRRARPRSTSTISRSASSNSSAALTSSKRGVT